MRVIYKYQFSENIELPAGFTVRHVGEQNGFVTLWIEVDPDAPCTRYPFRVIGTGHELPPARFFEYHGSVQIGPFVWHVYGPAPIREVPR